MDFFFFYSMLSTGSITTTNKQTNKQKVGNIDVYKT